MLEDGRRHVAEFLLAGDVFGWDAGDEHEFAAEVVTPVILQRFAVRTLEDRAKADPAFALRLRQYVAGQVRAARGRIVMRKVGGWQTLGEKLADPMPVDLAA